MKIKFWGTRGSIPVPGNQTLKYGGNTPCVEIQNNAGKRVIFDAGSGIRALGQKIASENLDNEVKIFLSHYHWDHIQGFPFFIPLYEKNYKIKVYGMPMDDMSTIDFLSKQMAPHYFPIKLNEAASEVICEDVINNQTYELDGMKIETFLVNHPSPTLTYKVTEGNKSLVYMTDNEIYSFNENNEIISLQHPDFLDNNKELIEFCNGCDYLIHDAMYDEDILLEKKGWGHSGHISSAYFSILSNVKNLILFHYNPEYTDTKIDEMLRETKEVLTENSSQVNCIAAAEGLEISF